MLYVLQNIHWFVILIGALVFFHELGHFLVAKACGVKVLRFSLGFGPKLVGFTRGDTEYRISALPLGGYVKMMGDTPGVEIPPGEAHQAFLVQPVWRRMAIVAAGPAFNFLLALVVYAFMFTGTQTIPDTKLGVVSRGDPAWNAGLRPGDKIVAINGQPVERWEDLLQGIGERPGETLRLTYQRGDATHTVEVSPEAREEANIFKEIETRGRIGVSLQYVRPLIAVIDPESPAAQAGLRTGDLVTRVGSTPIAAWHELRAALEAWPADQPAPITVRRAPEGAARGEGAARDRAEGEAPGKELTFTLAPAPGVEPPAGIDPGLFSSANASFGYTGLVSKDTIVAEVEENTPADEAGLRPGDRLLALAIRKQDGAFAERPIGVWDIDLAAFSGVDARSEFTLTIQRGREVLKRTFELVERQEQDELKNTHTRYVFGATNDRRATDAYVYQKEVGVVEAIAQAGARVVEDTTLTSKGLALLARGRLPLDSMGGPIMLFVIAEKSAKRGAEHFLGIMAIISVHLGLLNLLPVPVLDGGHLLFFGIEAVRRRPPSIRTREIANAVGLALLLMLMVLVFKNDILRYVLG